MMREISWSGDGFQLPLLQSAAIPAGFHHGFTTRQGGISPAPFDSLNLGGRWGDAAAHVAENHRRLRLAAGGRALYFANQVHGRDSVLVSPGDSLQAVASARADAVIAGAPAIAGDACAVAVYAADCVPVLIADSRSGACAAVHAGWRGTVAGVVSATLERMATTGTQMGDVRIAIGPSIGPCCFEVGPEVVAAAEQAFPEARQAGAIRAGGARSHLDLWLLNRLAAEGSGVPRDAIDVGGRCTSCDRDRFFSYRRDRGITGLMAAFIVRAQEPRKNTP